MMMDSLLNFIEKSEKNAETVFIAVDGRSGSGKSYFAEESAKDFSVNLFHMDDFFLPFKERPENFGENDGDNIDFLRIINELILPLKSKKACVYRKFCCMTQSFSETQIPYKKINILEGTFSAHQKLREYIDFTVLLEADEKTRIKRLKEREKDNFEAFKFWLEREENYFKNFREKPRQHICVLSD